MRHEHSQKFANCPSDHHWQFEPHIFPPLVQYFSACKVPPETVNYGSIQPADLPKCSQPCSLCLCHHKSLRYIVAKDFNFRRCFRNLKQSPGMLVKPLWILVDIYFCRISSIKWPDDCCAEYQCSASGSTKVGTCDRYVKWRCNN